jgi:hypothetical protein
VCPLSGKPLSQNQIFPNRVAQTIVRSLPVFLFTYNVLSSGIVDRLIIYKFVAPLSWILTQAPLVLGLENFLLKRDISNRNVNTPWFAVTTDVVAVNFAPNEGVDDDFDH